jgi:two-component system, OmpR family, sensor histidine kinase MprB
MTFRRRIAIASAAAVTIAVVLASGLIYVLTSNQLHSQVDEQLHNRARTAGRLQRYLKPGSKTTAAAKSDSERLGLDINRLDGKDSGEAANSTAEEEGSSLPHYGPAVKNLFGKLPPGPDQVRGYQQVVNAAGTIVVRSARDVSLPVDVETLAFGAGRAVQLAQPLTEVDSLLSRLRLILALIALGGIALAALLGRLVAGAAVLPLKRLTQATEHVALTQDLSGRIKPVGPDEIGRLARSFNSMLDALESSMTALDDSVHAQRQLVADASHELRTPVTSLRTNIELLQQAEDMEPHDRQRLLSDVVEQIEELTLLMNDLIELARGEEPFAATEDVRLDLLARDVIERACRHAPGADFAVGLEPTVVPAVAARLERAISNLIDNAVKYSPPHEPVEVALADGELTVRDHGPGISTADQPHVFDRFYRGAEARGRPGSGLGLAIVRQVVEQQGGAVSAERAPGGGTLMRMRLAGAETIALEAAADPRIAGLAVDAGAAAGVTAAVTGRDSGPSSR